MACTKGGSPRPSRHWARYKRPRRPCRLAQSFVVLARCPSPSRGYCLQCCSTRQSVRTVLAGLHAAGWARSQVSKRRGRRATVPRTAQRGPRAWPPSSAGGSAGIPLRRVVDGTIVQHPAWHPGDPVDVSASITCVARRADDDRPRGIAACSVVRQKSSKARFLEHKGPTISIGARYL